MSKQPNSKIIPAIQNRNEALLNHALSQTSQVLPIRLDIRYPLGYSAPADNSVFQGFIAELRRYFHNQGYSPLYIWVKEISTSDNFHFHICFLLDGNSIRWMPNQNQAEIYWAKALSIPPEQAKGLINFQTCSMVKRDDPSSIAYCLSYLEYFAKDDTKQHVPKSRMYGSSIIPAN